MTTKQGKLSTLFARHHLLIILACLMPFVVGYALYLAYSPPYQSKKNPYTRDELKEALKDKSKDEVLKLLGRPQRTTANGIFEHWEYPGRTYDPIAQRNDTSLTITFSTTGRVLSISH